MKSTDIQSTLLEALKGAGEILRTTIGERKIVNKKTELSLVTATDEKAEKLIIETILGRFPDHAILAEESLGRGESPSRWIIDPLDGTTNFAHTFPVCCVSIGFEHNGEMEAGGIYDPFRDELFYAGKGLGATMNGQPISVSNTDKLADSLLCTGFPYDRRKCPDEYLELVKAFMLTAQGIRRVGAAALDLCYVACGRLDGFWEAKLAPWDKAAGMLIVKEAGGTVTNYAGEPLTLDHVQNVASNGKIHPEMLHVLKDFLHVGISKD